MTANPATGSIGNIASTANTGNIAKANLANLANPVSLVSPAKAKASVMTIPRTPATNPARTTAAAIAAVIGVATAEAGAVGAVAAAEAVDAATVAAVVVAVAGPPRAAANPPPAAAVPPVPAMPATEARLDKWLWCVRLFRTRTLATNACQEGRVQVNQQPAKPARAVRPGDLVIAKQGDLTRTLKVIGLPDSRVGAKLVPHYLEDLTPPEELAKPRQPDTFMPGYRPKGTGRPTKRDRRILTRYFGDPEPG